MRRAAVVVAATLAVACGSSAPLSPTAEPSVESVLIEGGDEVGLGGTTVFQLVAGYVGGTRRDVTAESTWTSESALLSFDAPGLARGLAPGSGVFHVVFQGRTASRRVSVLPPGTFQTSGRVTEAGAESFPLVNARVTVTAGIGTGLTADTDWNGNFWLYGVAGPVRFDVTKDGYYAETRSTDVTRSGPQETVEMRLTQPRPEMSGDYVVTISASGQCGTGLGDGSVPEEARSRSYALHVIQESGPGPRLHGILSSPGVTSFSVDGRMEPGRASWELEDSDDGFEFGPGPGALQSRLPSGASLTTRGIATVAISADRLIGTLSGWLEVSGPSRPGPFIASCRADDHQFVMTR